MNKTTKNQTTQTSQRLLMPAVAARAASTRLAVSAKQSSISLSSLSPSRTVSHSRNFDDLGDVGGSSSGSLNAGLPE